MAHEPTAGKQPSLPDLIFGVSEIRRLRRELETLEDYLRQANIREAGKQAPLPRVSKTLESLAAENNFQLLKADHRQRLAKFLEILEQHAPSVHISFAVDPSGAFTAKLVNWMRGNIHPYVLVETGLQPTIAAGCIMRTTNKVFDFSLRNRFVEAQSTLAQALDAVTAPQSPVETAAPEPVVVAESAAQ
ncbi:MAG TPA: hypothetical protein VMR45_02450 [Patescibacteria group bacterium]|nr:hypothetical protein [Patescibacteria group bacterium]